jgi:hypothetical protein
MLSLSHAQIECQQTPMLDLAIINTSQASSTTTTIIHNAPSHPQCPPSSTTPPFIHDAYPPPSPAPHTHRPPATTTTAWPNTIRTPQQCHITRRTSACRIDATQLRRHGMLPSPGEYIPLPLTLFSNVECRCHVANSDMTTERRTMADRHLSSFVVVVYIVR